MFEAFKILGSFLTGGLAGAALTEWFRRRRERVQKVELIERVNRQVGPRLEGVTLARWVRSEDHPDDQLPPRLEEVPNLREYQLTMRNSTSIHLENAEIQFDFAADEVSADVQRPALSQTQLEPVDPKATPYRTAYRWKIPQLPSGDSVEFTFRAINSKSKNYEVALYHKGVVLDRIVGEPPTTKRRGWFTEVLSAVIAVTLSVASGFVFLSDSNKVRLSDVQVAGCNLQISSETTLSGWRGPWTIRNRILNIGNQDCHIQSKELIMERPVVIGVGASVEREKLSNSWPKLNTVSVSVGSVNNPPSSAAASIYVESD